ncbi:hypothetical protein Pmani_005077 [Petrolisthes manimaculis]|uniref:Uncharacterized protein n=1 Tax=Petrolisthes manimaculis TaxID=1843537 RepID=A0AAE1QFK3_9EUCA|nr:hypothetical protein Pmani_005077 [Petrolisthes manimaculis]
MRRHNNISPRPTVPHPESKDEACVLAPTYEDEEMDSNFSALLMYTNVVELQQVYHPSPATEFTLPELAQQFKLRTARVMTC